MSFPDYLLTRDEPGHRAPEFGCDHFHGMCPVCITGEGEADGTCSGCDPRVGIEYSPVRASFRIDTATGAVVENGWS